MNRYLLTTNCMDLSAYKRCAEENGFGLEIQAFAEPRALAGGWREMLGEHKKQLNGFSGDLGFHGAFYDMNSGSRDPDVVELTRNRYRENLCAASELEAKYVILHLNYLGPMNLLGYHDDWQKRQLDFWSSFVNELPSYGVPVLLENSWENKPDIVVELIQEMGSPYLRACLDVAHATIYSKVAFADWLQKFEPYLECCHLNNHDGEHDLHLPLNEGVIDYQKIVSQLGDLTNKPYLCLELPSMESINSSLDFLQANALI